MLEYLEIYNYCITGFFIQDDHKQELTRVTRLTKRVLTPDGKWMGSLWLVECHMCYLYVF